MFEHFVIGAPDWVWPALVAFVTLCGFVTFAYWYAPGAGLIRILAGCMKGLALACITLCLINPLWSGKRPKPQANIVAVVVDDSHSMQMRAAGDTMSRAEHLRRVLAPESSWRKRLEQDFDVRQYAFDGQLKHVGEFDSLKFEGTSSALATTLETLKARYSDRPVAGIVLFTDGNATDMVRNAQELSKRKIPIYPVVIANNTTLRDLAITNVVANQTDFETTPATVDVQLSAIGMQGTPVVVQLLDRQQNVVQEQTTSAPADDDSAIVHFRFRPTETGTQFFQVIAATRESLTSLQAGELRDECTDRNNKYWVTVQRRRGPYRVLYVSGRPTWEFKFLRRAVQEDPEMTLVGLIRIAKASPKFAFRDRAVSGANPLFEGFSADDEATAEQRDEPVLLRIGVDSKEELANGFPTDASELFRYDAVVVDDVEASFFTQDQMLLLRRFVSDRGGGLLLLGGADAVDRAGYESTPLAEMAPVYTVRDQSSKPDANVHLQLTREGWLQPWLRLRATEVAEQERLATVPAFRVWNLVERTKPGATTMASINVIGEEATSQTERPALVVQRFGRGRTASWLIGDLWRWGLHRPPDAPHDLPQAWRQSIRWLTSDVPRRVETNINANNGPDAPVEIRVVVRDEEFRRLDNVDIDLAVVLPDGSSTVLKPVASTESTGLYVTTFWPKQTGGYRAIATATATDGSPIGSMETGWVSDPAADEYRRVSVDRELLVDVAQQSGGELIAANQLDQFVASLPHRAVPVTEVWTYPLWHQPWVLGLAVLAVCAEWGIRRWKGLP